MRNFRQKTDKREGFDPQKGGPRMRKIAVRHFSDTMSQEESIDTKKINFGKQIARMTRRFPTICVKLLISHSACTSTYIGGQWLVLDSAGVSTCVGFNQLTCDLIGENMSSYSVKKTLLEGYSTFFSFFSLKPAPNAYH